MGEPFVDLSDDESFRFGYALLLAISATMIPRAIFGPTTAIMALRGLQVPVVWIVVLGVVISLLLCLVLYPVFGAASIAIAYLAASTFVSVVQWWWAKRQTGIDCSIFAQGNLQLLRRQLRLSFVGA